MGVHLFSVPLSLPDLTIAFGHCLLMLSQETGSLPAPTSVMSQAPDAGATPSAPPAKEARAASTPKKKTMIHHLLAGGTAGFVESSCW